MSNDEYDPKGLIRESYRIEGITESECRSIFLDWALSIPVGADVPRLVSGLLARYVSEDDDHPMTVTLRAAMADTAAPRRRGGRAGRFN